MQFKDIDISSIATRQVPVVRPRATFRVRALFLLLIGLLAAGSLGGVALLVMWRAGTSDSYQPTQFTPPLASPGGSQTLGISSDGAEAYPGIPWLRLSYKSCGNNNFSGSILTNLVAGYHRHGIHVLLLVCQETLAHLLDSGYLADAAHAKADAVQCGNEEMKHDPPYTRYVPANLFAQFFVACEQVVHQATPDSPVLLGSLDPHIVGSDTAALIGQENYLDNVQLAMNTTVDPGGNWTWQSQIVGINDSAHNGYPLRTDNNLYQLFTYWAKAFRVTLDQLHAHLWVVEGTACFTCTTSPDISHIMTLVTDVLTATRYHVPFFYFTGRDFTGIGAQQKMLTFPYGVLTRYGAPKPLRQDVPMGSVTLSLTCGSRTISAQQQEQLLALLYAGCQLPANYAAALEA